MSLGGSELEGPDLRNSAEVAQVKESQMVKPSLTYFRKLFSVSHHQYSLSIVLGSATNAYDCHCPGNGLKLCTHRGLYLKKLLEHLLLSFCGPLSLPSSGLRLETGVMTSWT
jgi:hypothetical protein